MYKKILVVVDEREISQSAIDQGIALARVHRADIMFFYVLPRYVYPSLDMVPVAEATPEEFQRQSSEQASQRLAAASAQAERAGVHSHRAMGTGTDDAHCVAEAATQRHCDLIVVATEEKNAVVRLLTGSIVPGLISAATVPLLICRAKTVRAATPRLRVGHKPRT
jgi:nucleotide-binding universal stress UspA family protein